MRKNVVIVAGGRGLRMNQAFPKQFMILSGKPVIVHAIEAFLRYDPEINLTVVVSNEHFSAWEEAHRKYLPGVTIVSVPGGSTRFQSVRSGLEMVSDGLVAIHDAVRPLVSVEVIALSFQSAEKTGSGVVMVPLKDSVRKKEGEVTRAVDRSLYFSVQTPQTFRVELIRQAFEQDEKPVFTDDASVFESAGREITPVIGEYTNIKITTPEDLALAEILMKQKSP